MSKILDFLQSIDLTKLNFLDVYFPLDLSDEKIAEKINLWNSSATKPLETMGLNVNEITSLLSERRDKIIKKYLESTDFKLLGYDNSKIKKIIGSYVNSKTDLKTYNKMVRIKNENERKKFEDDVRRVSVGDLDPENLHYPKHELKKLEKQRKKGLS